MAVSSETVRLRMTGDDRRALILAVGREVFAERGFHAAGTAEIAARAGCSEPTIYKHFPSKQALFAAVLEDATDARDHVERGHGAPTTRSGDVGRGAARRERPLVIQTIRLRMLASALVDDREVRAAIRPANAVRCADRHRRRADVAGEASCAQTSIRAPPPGCGTVHPRRGHAHAVEAPRPST